jgi:hypothetical protein
LEPEKTKERKKENEGAKQNLKIQPRTKYFLKNKIKL